MSSINVTYKSLSDVDSITIEDLNINIGSLSILEDTYFNIAKGINYGLVSPNGHGKTTLLKTLAYKIPIKNINIHMVKQENTNSDLSVIDELLSSHNKYNEFINKESELNKIINDSNQSDDEILQATNQLDKLYTDAKQYNLLSIKSNASKILHGLGFYINSKKGNMQTKKMNDYSGGWRMRVSIAKGILNEPDLLILDEPTNHLDLNAVIWLGNYLKNWNISKNTKQKSLLLVSHDENFINEICNKMIRIENKKLKIYSGNYEKMQLMIEQEKQVKLKEYNKQIKTIKSKKEKRKLKIHDYKVDFDFNSKHIYNGKIELNNVSFKYDTSNYQLLNLNINVQTGDKIVIVGKNGAGKSTILKLLTGELLPINGDRIVSKNLKIGKYYQHFEDSMPMDKSPVEYLQTLHPEHSVEFIRSHLSKFNLSSSAHTIPISKCSGGQKSRIAFSILSLSDILILDEPTNHLDLESINGLSTSLQNYKGGLILVSHDAKLIRDLNCIIYICDNNSIRKFNGDFDDYHNLILDEIENSIQPVDKQPLSGTAYYYEKVLYGDVLNQTKIHKSNEDLNIKPSKKEIKSLFKKKKRKKKKEKK